MPCTTANEWTDEKPDVEGWYWYIGDNWHRPVCIEVFRDGHHWCASERKAVASTWQFLLNMDGRWAGPILPPAY